MKRKLKLREFLKLVKEELEAYSEETKDKPIIAVLKEVTITVQVSSITSAKGGLNIVLARVGGRRAIKNTHTITLKFVSPEPGEKKFETLHLMGRETFEKNRKLVFVGKAEKSNEDNESKT